VQIDEETPEALEWQKFLCYPFSGRARNFFENANIKTVGQLAAMSKRELLRYRGVGRKMLLEIKVALANHGPTPGGGTPAFSSAGTSDGVSKAKEIEELLEAQTKLEAQLRAVKEKIVEARASMPRKPKLKPAVFARWLEIRDYHAVAKEFSLTSSKVSSIVSEAFRQRLKSKGLNEAEIVNRWREARSYQQVAREFDVPEFLVRNIVVRLNKRA
jgi:DNA-directed RNA polymerase specialized sigma24 family protein